MPGDLCTAQDIIKLSRSHGLTDVTDVTPGASGLYLGTWAGAGDTTTLKDFLAAAHGSMDTRISFRIADISFSKDGRSLGFSYLCIMFNNNFTLANVSEIIEYNSGIKFKHGNMRGREIKREYTKFTAFPIKNARILNVLCGNK